MADKEPKQLKRTLTFNVEDWEILEELAVRDGCGDAKDYIYKLIGSDLRHRGA